MYKNKIIRRLVLALAAAAAILSLCFILLKSGGDRPDAGGVPGVGDMMQEPDSASVTREDGPDEDDGPGELLSYGIPVGKYDVVDGRIREGEFFSSLLAGLGVPGQKIAGLTECSRGVFDLRKIRAGNEYHAFYTADERRGLDYIVYDIDTRGYVRFSLGDTLRTEVFEKEVRTVMNYSRVEINTSLWVDVRKAGAPALLALKLSDIYAWTIDFFGLQKGDTFEAVYETAFCGDRLLGVERVLYASFIHSGRAYESYWYDNPDDSNLYWNEKGESMRKAFLKAPLSFTRISSGYGRRVHPVTRRVHQHTGVDYAAPKGTPVMAIGDGTVVFAGRKGNEGNMVKIKHNSVYTTAYLHLSGFGRGVRSGARVSQGQVIGYVGSTGRSTGPHLDFRVWKNGSPVNPLKMSSPPAAPIGKDRMGDFEKAKSDALDMKVSLMAEDAALAILDHLRGEDEEN